MAPAIRIGIDFDNTIAGYDHVFTEAARETGWLAPGAGEWTKRGIRDALRDLPDGEIKWQKLQARVYGARMADAVPLDGLAEFFALARRADWRIFIVSHKTQFAAYDPDGIDLRAAARAWIAAQQFPVPMDDVYFEPTRGDKIARIVGLGCTHFVDDLEEVFADPAFPAGVERLLLSSAPPPALPGIATFRSWHDITRHLFN